MQIGIIVRRCSNDFLEIDSLCLLNLQVSFMVAMVGLSLVIVAVVAAMVGLTILLVGIGYLRRHVIYIDIHISRSLNS